MKRTMKILKSKLVIIALISLLIISCKKNKDETNYGLEIYLPETPYFYQSNINCSKIDFDTILLSRTPIIKYNNIEKYDSATHTLFLSTSDKYFTTENDNITGSMFVVTINKTPIYCGFRRFVAPPPYSLPPPIKWVYIDVPISVVNQISLRFESTSYPDPRLDKRIIEKLKLDGKLE